MWYVLYVMKNRPLVKKMLKLTSTATSYNQLKVLRGQILAKDYTVLKAGLASTNPINADDEKQLPRWGYPAIKWLMGDWKRKQHESFIDNEIRTELIKARNNVIATMELKGVSKDTAIIVARKGFARFLEGLDNG